LLCALFVAIFALAVGAQTTHDQPAAGAVEAATATAGHAEAPPVAPIAPTVFHIGPLPVTNSMICTWIVALLILVIIRLTTWNLKEVPTGGQNVIESICEIWENLAGGVLEPKVVRWVFPYATTFFIFIVISNFVDLLPGVGSIGYGIRDTSSSLPFAISHAETPFFRPPTSDANLTVAMAGIFLVMCLYWAFVYNGPVGLVRHIFGIKVETNKWAFLPLMLLFLFIGVMDLFSVVFIRPVALALRLYGNIFGGETMLTMALTQKPLWFAVLVALPSYFFEVVVCLLQAFVFAMLTIAFVGTLCTPADETGHSH